MAEEMKGTNISSPVVPFTKDDKYATHDETFGRGGYRSVNSISEMNAIPSERRKEGMLVNVIGDKIYKLTNGSFVDAGLGSGGSGGGSSTSNVKILTTPNLIYPSRPVSLTLSEQDTNILNNLSPDDVVMAYDKLGEMELLIPISVNKFFPRITLGYLVNGLNYVINISYLSNTYEAQPPISMTSKKQDLLVSGTNIKTINGNSILGSGNIQIAGGSGGGEVYVTSLELEYIYDTNELTQAQYDELLVIYSKWKEGIPVIINGDRYNGMLNIYTSNSSFNSQTTISIRAFGLDFIHEWNVRLIVGSLWHLTQKRESISLNFQDVLLIDGYNGTTIDGDELYDSFKAFELNKNGHNPIYVTGIDGWSGVNIPIESSDMDQQFYITFYEKKYLVKYDINNDDITYTVSDITKYDLSIEVKTASDGIYYRIKERVPNGYIQFVRKKRHKYYPSGIGRVNRTGYSVLGLDFNHNSVGVSAMETTPNVWYKFPITKERLYSKYTQGSIIESLPGVHARNYNTIRLCGNTHAKPIKYGDNGTVYNLRKTSVLHAGLQYNVLHPDYVNKVSPKVIFKQRGEIVPIDVRMTVDPKSFSLDPVLYFAVQ